MGTLKTAKNIYMVMTIIAIVGGALFLLWPGIGLDILCRVCGIFLFLYGLAKISSYFTKDLFQLAFQFDFGLGMVILILGALMVFGTNRMEGFLAFCIGTFMLVDAALRIQTAFEAKRFGIERWKWILFIAIASGIAGVFLLVSPMETTSLIVRMVGLGICLDGVMNLVVVMNTVRTIRKSEKDRMEFE